MRVRFFPRRCDPFRDMEEFDFQWRVHRLTKSLESIQLIARYKFDHKDFYDRAEFIEWLKGLGFDLTKYPLEIKDHPRGESELFEGKAYIVGCCGFIGELQELL